jgi:hypothetical protein
MYILFPILFSSPIYRYYQPTFDVAIVLFVRQSLSVIVDSRKHSTHWCKLLCVCSICVAHMKPVVWTSYLFTLLQCNIFVILQLIYSGIIFSWGIEELLLFVRVRAVTCILARLALKVSESVRTQFIAAKRLYKNLTKSGVDPFHPLNFPDRNKRVGLVIERSLIRISDWTVPIFFVP